MSDGDSDKEALLEALEEFVLDSESITSLEARFGGFNVFEALGMSTPKKDIQTF